MLHDSTAGSSRSFIFTIQRSLSHNAAYSVSDEAYQFWRWVKLDDIFGVQSHQQGAAEWVADEWLLRSEPSSLSLSFPILTTHWPQLSISLSAIINIIRCCGFHPSPCESLPSCPAICITVRKSFVLLHKFMTVTYNTIPTLHICVLLYYDNIPHAYTRTHKGTFLQDIYCIQ